mgnify:CR=1 FL=1
MEIADVDNFGREYILSKKKEKIACNNLKRTACFGSSFFAKYSLLCNKAHCLQSIENFFPVDVFDQFGITYVKQIRYRMTI